MFETKVITGKGLFLLNQLSKRNASGDRAHIRFDACFCSSEDIPKNTLHNFPLTYEAARQTHTEGTLFRVSPTKVMETSDSRVVCRFSEYGEGLTLNNVFLFASLVQDEKVNGEEIVVEGMDHVLFSIASTKHPLRIDNDGHNGMYVTFQLLLSNGYSRIISVEHGLATMQDLEELDTEQTGGVATIMFNAATSDLQLFDHEGRLIDQANLPVGMYNNGEFVTTRNRQYVYDAKIWIDPEAVYENPNTLYGMKSSANDTDYRAFGIRVGENRTWFREMDNLGAVQTKALFQSFVANYELGQREDGTPQFTWNAASQNNILEKLSKPSVTDFFNISKDRDTATLEDIGEDTVLTLQDDEDQSSLNEESRLRLLQGYMQLAIEDGTVLDASFNAFVESKLPRIVSVISTEDSGRTWFLELCKKFGFISNAHSPEISPAELLESALASIQEHTTNDDAESIVKRRRFAKEILSVYPNELLELPEGLSALKIPAKAIKPEDIKDKYTATELIRIKQKYAVLESEEISTATITTLKSVLIHLYEAQVERARRAYIAADNAWRSLGGTNADIHSVELRNDGIILNKESHQYKIHLQSEDINFSDAPKLALSRNIPTEDGGGRTKTFAFIGDSGMLGGAPLFSVRVAAHAFYDEGFEWVLNSLDVSDGFKAILYGATDINGATTDEDKANILFIRRADNMTDELGFTHISIDIYGITGSNQTPCNQHKHLNCIVPFKNSYSCEVDLTEPLFSWVQTDVDTHDDEEQLPPDMIVINGYGLNIKKTIPPKSRMSQGIGYKHLVNTADRGDLITTYPGDGVSATIHSDENYELPVFSKITKNGDLDGKASLRHGTQVSVLAWSNAGTHGMALIKNLSDGKVYITDPAHDVTEHIIADAPSAELLSSGTRKNLSNEDQLEDGLRVSAVRVSDGENITNDGETNLISEAVVVAEMKDIHGKVAGLIVEKDGTEYMIQPTVQTTTKEEIISDTERASNAFDYIHDEASWNESFRSGGLRKYYTKYPEEDLWNTVENRACNYNDRIADFVSYEDAEGTKEYATGRVQFMWDDVLNLWSTPKGAKVKVIENSVQGFVGNVYYVRGELKISDTLLELFSDASCETSVGIYVKITNTGFSEDCNQCWEGAVNAPGAKYPWIVANFDLDVNAKLRFEYEGKDSVYPWGNKVFHKGWGCASIPVGFSDDAFKVSADGSGSSFDIGKFRMILENQK